MIKTGRFSLIAALIVPILFSCTPVETLEPEEEIISPKTGEAGSSEGLVKMEFVGALSDEDDSRTYLHEDGTSVLWKGSDKIAVIDEASPYIHVFDNTAEEGGATCRFIGEAADAEAWTVVYPASAFAHLAESNKATVTIPAVQTAVPGSFAEGSYITYCRVNTKNFTMQPLVSMLKITLAYENIKQIRVLANSNDTFTGDVRPLAGTFRFTSNLYYNSPVKLNYSNGVSGITLNPPVRETTFPAGVYYIPVAPLGDSNGCYQAAVANLRLEFTREDDQVASRSLVNTSIVFQRGKYFDLGTVDEGLSWDNLDICFGVAASGAAHEANYRCPFVSWTNDNWEHTNDPPATMKNTVFDLDGNEVQFKLKDSGHILKAWTQNPRGATGSGDDTRYANGSPALFFGSTAGSYLEFPAMRNRRLLRVEVQYDSTTTHDAKVGFSYVADRDASTCPRITDLTGTSIGYTMSRDGDGFHHNYILYDTELNTPYRYTLNFNGGNWTGPRVQRIRLYYSKEAAPNLLLPELSASGYSSSLRESHLTINLTAANGALVNQSAYDVGIVVKGDGVSISDKVIYLNSTTASIAGTVLTWETDYRIPSSDDVLLNDEVQFYPFARIKGDATDPLKMTAGTSGTNWVAGALTTITRPSYTWDISDTENYLYVSDTSVELNATVTVASAVTQNYDVGFIYKVAGVEDTPANWNCTYVDQNGTSSAFSGYELADGAYKTFSATLTGLSAGQTYVYKPVIIQHAICYFGYGYGGGASENAHLFKFLLYEDGYGLPNETLRKTISGPVIAVGSKPARVPTGYYTAATTGYVNDSDINVSHVKCSTNFVTGYLYGTSAHPTTGIRTRNSSVFPYENGKGDVIVYATNNLDASDELTGLTDSDGATCYYRPYFAFADGTVNYPLATDYTFTCPTVSVPTSGDYLWRTATTADLMGTIAISDSNCQMEIGYSTNGGSIWTTSTQNLAAGAQTIGSASGITEGGQTVKFGARRSGSIVDGTWKALDIELAHPIASVYTYGCAVVDGVDDTYAQATIAGQFTPYKVASDVQIDYGAVFRADKTPSSSDPGSPRPIDGGTVTVSAAEAVNGNYDVVIPSITRADHYSLTYPFRYWFWARIHGSSSYPTAELTNNGSSRSGRYITSFAWTSTAIKRRVFIKFNQDFGGSGRGVTPYYLPTPDGTDKISSDYVVKNGMYNMPCDLYFRVKVSSEDAVAGATLAGDNTPYLKLIMPATGDFFELPGWSGHYVRRIIMYGHATSGLYPLFLVTDADGSNSYYTCTFDAMDTSGFSQTIVGTYNTNFFANTSYSEIAALEGLPVRMVFSGAAVTTNHTGTGKSNAGTSKEMDLSAIWVEYL